MNHRENDLTIALRIAMDINLSHPTRMVTSARDKYLEATHALSSTACKWTASGALRVACHYVGGIDLVFAFKVLYRAADMVTSRHGYHPIGVDGINDSKPHLLREVWEQAIEISKNGRE